MNTIKSENVKSESNQPIITPPPRIIKAADIAPDFNRRKKNGGWQFPVGQSRAYLF